MKKLETSITRDLSFIDINAWYEGYQNGIKKWLNGNWSYSDTIFYVHDNHVEIMRPSQEYSVGFKNFILKKIDLDRSWFSKEVENLDILMQEIYRFYDTSLEKFKSDVTNIEMVQIYEKYIGYIKKSIGPFIMMYGVPSWLENDAVQKEKYKDEIKSSFASRKKVEYLFPRGAELTNAILGKVGKNLPIKLEHIKMLSAAELLNYLSREEIPDQKNLVERNSGFIYSNKGITLLGKTQSAQVAFMKLGYEFTPKEKVGTKELVGQIACPGKASGKVRVILSKKDISTLKEGEVLVTAMTTPEYLPAMQKSSAFVTDEGGITCHAAIVARELKKPCIIGTKIATQVLKDGDMVEVDAEKGIVRKM